MVVKSTVLAMALAVPAAIVSATPAPPPSSDTVNLALGRHYTITPLVSIQNSFAKSEAKYSLPGTLTGGRLASSICYTDPQWQGFCRGGARTVVVDLGGVDTVRQLRERFLHNPGAGIFFPRWVTYSLSLNGRNWTDVGTIQSTMPLTTNATVTQTYRLAGLDYPARFVRMTFPVDGFVFADEFQAFGTHGKNGDSALPAFTPPQRYPQAYTPPGSHRVGGTRNMVLIPNGYYGKNPAIEKNTVEQLTPYVGYRTAGGKITDFMFDSVLFSPYGDAPSGGNYGANLKKPTVLSDWTYYLDNTFDPTSNLAALNIATSNVKKLLNQPSYRTKVEIAIPYPTPTATAFGKIDGIGANLSRLSDQERVLKWYVDEVMTKWSRAKFTNLDLVGFYWFSEKAAFTENASEARLLRYIGDYARSRGKVLDWIPFLDAEGFTEWKSLGFDGAEMQPNYSFGDFPEAELGEAADTCRMFGMGIEIEIHWNALVNPALRAKYYAYLNWGVKKGYMTGAAHSYYQNSGPGTFYDSCVSTNPEIRAIYDNTYKFIKGTYTPTVCTSVFQSSNDLHDGKRD